MKFFTLLMLCLSLFVSAEHASDRVLDSVVTMIDSKSDRRQIDRYFMEASRGLDLSRFSEVLKRVKQHKIEAMIEGPVIYYPINETAIYMLETKDGWKFAPSVTRHFDDIYKAAFKFSSPEKTTEYFIQNILDKKYSEALSCIIRGKENFHYSEGTLPKESIFALENFAVYLQQKPLNTIEADFYDVDVLRTYHTSLGEINFVFFFLVCSSHSNPSSSCPFLTKGISWQDEIMRRSCMFHIGIF